MSDHQSVKVTFAGTKRRFSIPTTTSYAEFLSDLKARFNISDDLHVTYTDPDGDIIAVSSDDELKEMFLVNEASTLILALYTADTPQDTPQPPPQQRTPAEEAHRTAEQASQRGADAAREANEQASRSATDAQTTVEALLSGLGTFISSMGQMSGQMPMPPQPPPPPGMPFPGYGFGRGFGRRRRHEDFAAFAPLMAVFAPLAAAFHQGGSGGMLDFSEPTCSAFRQLRDAVTDSDNRDEILRTARDVFPSVREWALANLSGDLNEESISELCNTVSQTVEPVAGEHITGLVTNTIRTGLTDPAVLRVMRNIPWQMAFDFEAEMREPGMRGRGRGWGRGRHGHGGRMGFGGGGRFDVHRNVECDSCKKAPIVGSRYKATNRANYDLCAGCYNSDDVNKEGINFKECKYVWEAAYPDVAVPPSPIGFGDRGPAVAFLQKVLTDLGYMNASMYRWRVGYFGRNTKAGVEQFQREYGLESVAETGQYDATTAASLSSVIEVQVPPSAATGGAGPSDTPGGAAQGTPQADAPAAQPSPAQG